MQEIKVLEYLHDAVLHRVSIDFFANDRRLVFTATFHPDCGLSSIDGKTIEIVASDILIVTCCFFGDSMGQEKIDRCELGIPEKARERLLPMIRLGLGEPRMGLSLLTHTGSKLEVLYGALTIKGIGAQPAAGDDGIGP